MVKTLNIFIGYDPKESVVYHTCVQSILENTKCLVSNNTTSPWNA